MKKYLKIAGVITVIGLGVAAVIGIAKAVTKFREAEDMMDYFEGKDDFPDSLDELFED